MNQAFLDYYRCPQEFVDFRPAAGLLDGSTSGSLGAVLDPARVGLADADGEERHSPLRASRLPRVAVAKFHAFFHLIRQLLPIISGTSVMSTEPKSHPGKAICGRCITGSAPFSRLR